MNNAREEKDIKIKQCAKRPSKRTQYAISVLDVLCGVGGDAKVE